MFLGLPEPIQQQIIDLLKQDKFPDAKKLYEDALKKTSCHPSSAPKISN